MERIKSLLNQVTIVRKKNTEILDASGSRFNMFSICGVNHYENTHSAIIAEFLNPTGTHGLKSKFLESFTQSLGHVFPIVNFNYEKSRVSTEYSTEEGRIDILIEDNQNNAIIIENKLSALDQPEQLKRYDRYAKMHKKDYLIIYLTLKGEDASEQSGGGVSYLRISYEKHIINWLDKCVAISSRFPIVRETIIQYINHLKQLTHQDMDSKNKEEITQILSKADNLRAAKTIVENYHATFEYILNEHFNPKMNEFARQKGLEYHYESCYVSHIRFYLTKPSWEDKCLIGFTLEGDHYFYGLYNDLDMYNVSTDNRERLHKKLHDLGVSSHEESPKWPFYSSISLTIDNWENDIIKSDNYFDECKNKINDLLSAMKEIDL